MGDISFKTEEGRFNYRVGCVLIADGRLLVMRDEGTDGYYLPGGRVHFGERAEEAAVREMQEELGIAVKVVRPLWVKEGFFTMFSNGRRCHEIGLYFLLDASGSDLFSRGDRFDREDEGVLHHFEWMDFDRLEQADMYPVFLRTQARSLPDSLTFITESC